MIDSIHLLSSFRNWRGFVLPPTVTDTMSFTTLVSYQIREENNDM